MKEKITMKQVWKKHTGFLNKDSLPITKHTNTYQPRKMCINAVGMVELDGEKYEFQDVRLYFPAESA